MSKLGKIFKDKHVTKETKIQIAETFVFPIVTYGKESWTDYEKKKKNRKTWCFWATDVVENSNSITDRKHIIKINFAENETKHFVRSPNKNSENVIFQTCDDRSILEKDKM